MKFLLPIGGTLDLNFSLGEGAQIDNVGYEVPSYSQEFISVNGSGLVTPIKVGTAIVNIKDSTTQRLLQSVAIQIVTPQQYETLSRIANNTTPLTATTVYNKSSN